MLTYQYDRVLRPVQRRVQQVTGSWVETNRWNYTWNPASQLASTSRTNDSYAWTGAVTGRDGGGPGAAAYGTSKGAVMTFTRAMAKELGPKGIRVDALAPA